MDHFVQSKNMDVEVRFDLITYVFKGDDWEQDHIEDAFYPFGWKCFKTNNMFNIIKFVKK